MFGLESDTEMQALAYDFLDEAIKEFNSYLFEFNKATQSVTLVADQVEYELDNTPYKESLAYLVRTSDLNKEPPLVHVPYVHFRRLYSTPSGGSSALVKGIPQAYTFRALEDDGKVTLYPVPDASAASDYTLTLEYYKRLPLVSDLQADTSKLDVPQEVESALLYGAQKRMAMHIHGPAHPDVSSLDSLENRALQRLIAIDRHHPDAKTRFRVAGTEQRRSVSNRGIPPSWWR